jgi:hypothetical protein
MSKDKLLSESIGKTVSIFYNDTANSVSFKKGKFLDFDSFNIKILENNSDQPALIPRAKCIRIEIEPEKAEAKARQ